MGGRGLASMRRRAEQYAKAGLITGGTSKDVTKEYKGLSLKQAEDKIRGEKHEVAVIFDKNMNVIGAYSGGGHNVRVPEVSKKINGITVTHNHPAGGANYGATFSPADILWFSDSKAKEFRVVASGQGEYLYSLQVRGKQTSKNVKYAKGQLNMYAQTILRDTLPKSSGGTGKLHSDYKREFKKFTESGMSKEEANHAAWQKATGIYDKKLTDFVGQIKNGAIYYVRNKKYDVNR